MASLLDAVDHALQAGDKVIVGEVQVTDANSELKGAFDDAFDAGSVMIAAAGNSVQIPCKVPNLAVAAPANGHKVMAAGAWDVGSETDYQYQCYGRDPTNGAQKPEFQGPTGMTAANNQCDTCKSDFGATSGATPFLAGFADLLVRYFSSNSRDIKPGNIYAAMVAFGTGINDNVKGLGIPWVSTMCARQIYNGGPNPFTVPQYGLSDNIFTIPANQADLQVGVFWAELECNHTEYIISVIDPNNVVRTYSYDDTRSVRNLLVLGSLTPGNWRVRIEWNYFLYYNDYCFNNPQLSPPIYIAWTYHNPTISCGGGGGG
jgi:hypothetical protein